MLENVLNLVESRQNLSQEQMTEALGLIMEGHCSEEEVARLLIALHEKGETVEEVAGAARAMRSRMTPIRTRRSGLIDTCGTGGDGSKTFNISTAAAIVAAAAGVPVAKHGNRGITSRSGSADALAALGVNIEADVACVEACLDELGLCFCFAPLLHRAMKHVAPVRKKIAAPTIFNILGPLVNPASAEFQLLGVGKPELQPLMAESLLRLGIRRGLVVHGCDGLDEVTLSGPTRVIEAASGRLRHFDWTPEDFGLQSSTRDSLLVNDPAESAALIAQILAGQTGPPRDIVLANAAAALWTVGRNPSLLRCTALAAETIDTGKARELLERLAERTQR
ncbi:MAG: anthranilate phosphoribosyltransferase [Pirellulales bacterium]|nr:anthranilate phosphoribosyltransferase [Pirellulales bacterium]